MLVTHVVSTGIVVGLAALTFKLVGRLAGSAIGIVLCASSVGVVWMAISTAQMPTVSAHEQETDTGEILISAETPAHSFTTAHAATEEAHLPELSWLSSQPIAYQAAVFRGELPEGQDAQRKIGALIVGLRSYFADDENIAAFLLSPRSLPLLLELRDALDTQWRFADSSTSMNMLLISSSTQTNGRVQALLAAIRDHAGN